MSAELNQTIEAASLDNLHDIIAPDAIGFFPLAPGWYIVLLLFLTLLFHLAWKRYKLYKKEQYKRDALAELSGLREQSKMNSIRLLSLAKRVAISAYERENIAKLSEDAWWDFMQTHSKAKISTELRKNIHTLLYEEDANVYDNLHAHVLNVVSEWIKTHKVLSDV